MSNDYLNMRHTSLAPGLWAVPVLAMALLANPIYAQKHELGFTMGTLLSQDRGSGTNALKLGSGIGLQVNYGYRFWTNDAVALYAEIHGLANGQRKIQSANPAATRDLATLYVTPGIRVKFAPNARIAPYFAVGGGYALYEQSFFRVDDTDNQAPRFLHRGAFQFGGGVDVKVWDWLALRGEVRDFYSGSPAYNLPIGGGQHNVMAGGGFVLRWGD